MSNDTSMFGVPPEKLDRLILCGLEPPAAPKDATPTASVDMLVEKVGSWIHSYRLVDVLGEGGMGVVYLAEQTTPIRRRVALKVIKPGMDSKRVIARFEAERQALAVLDHPNIAHVYDAGTTDSGRPYFVMEHIKGLPITEYCDRHKLTIDQRLRLFQQVCHGVQHAHQKGIIHRDIKPSNILVLTEGDEAIPKIIDFGVAKAISQPLTERTLVTEDSQLLGTPEYMSPEQADLTKEDIDTRSDIYSLGVVLYELLAGLLPFDSATFREGGVEHVRKAIRDTDPKTPSTRLGTVSSEEAREAARSRRTDVRTWTRRLHGDLDWIVMKAMEKDRVRRYQTAHALAEDIERHLRHEPVFAGPPSRVYRVKKLLQRHRSQALGTAAAGLLLAAVAVISVMYVQAANRSKETESLEHRNILSQAMDHRSKGQFQEAVAELESIVDSAHVGPEARLLHARTVLELQGPTEAISQLETLTNERHEIAWQAHLLLARIYLETNPDDPKTVQEYQRRGRQHQQEGEKLFSESAEAYFNRAMIAGTVDKNLEYLGKALEIDSGHYAARRARALGYYALRDYRNMERDAVAMTALRNWDPQGYSLLAIALRQTGDFVAALKHHDRAIEISPDDPELYDQRRQTYGQMGSPARALSDARVCLQLQPKNQNYHFRVFCELVASGRYGEASAEYDTIINSGLMTKAKLHLSAMKHVFDSLASGLSWHPPERGPTGAAFLAMVEAEEDYRRLVEKGARRVVPEGFSPAWSPDGTELVYSRGIHGFSGVEILNLKTGKTRLLTVPGMDPSWSPDGRYVAFARYRRAISLADIAVEHAVRVPPPEQREIWLIRADGTEEPRFLTKGHWPRWSPDSKQVFYDLPEDWRICSISLEEGSVPRPIIRCRNDWYPAVSPDGKYVSHGLYQLSVRRVVEISSGSLVANWAVPLGLRLATWSPDGCQLSAGGPDGLWIFDVGTKEPSQVLEGTVSRGSWSPDGSRMVFSFGDPFFQIWVAETESLKPGQTLKQHYQENVNRLTRRIDADPEDAQSHLDRARYSIYLGDRNTVLADLNKYASIVKDPSRAAQAYDVAAWSLAGRHQEFVDPEIAVELYAKAHEIQPQNWEYLCGLGASCYRTGRWGESITALMKATASADGENALNYLLLAMAHWQGGNKVAAGDWHDKALKWIEKTGADVARIRRGVIYDIYVEASELLGREIREF